MTVQPSRRALLGTSVAGLGALGVVASQRSSAAETTSAGTPATTKPLPTTTDPVLHAVRRLTYGATPALISEVRTLGLKTWIDSQLAGLPDASATLTSIGFSDDPLPPALANQINTEVGRNTVADLQAATIAKGAFGDNQLEEVMVEFWSNHFSMFGYNVGSLKVPDDRDVIRKNALGTFANLLKASAQSPAMLQSLNQAGSAGTLPNENYAREIMELHTVGVNAGYKQKDVHNAALALTGLTIDYSTGLFTYNKAYHPLGRVTVMGWTSANDKRDESENVTLSFISYLAHHPSTAKHLATKLVTRFVSDTPPASLVASAAKVYLDNDTSIKPVLQHIFSSAEFASSAAQKTQRPYEWCLMAIRVLGIQPDQDLVTNPYGVVGMMEQLSQAPFEWGPPNGYPDVTPAWASTASMLTRWNTAQALVHGYIDGLQAPDWNALVGLPAPLTAGALVTTLSEKLLNSAPRAALKAAVLHGVAATATQVIDTKALKQLAPGMAALLLSSPEAQVR